MNPYMGDIGDDQKEYEFEPIDVPIEIPEPVTVPSEPVGVPAS
jgi:hypothetical protein